jgi:hypothetical protein
MFGGKRIFFGDKGRIFLSFSFISREMNKLEQAFRNSKKWRHEPRWRILVDLFFKNCSKSTVEQFSNHLTVLFLEKTKKNQILPLFDFSLVFQDGVRSIFFYKKIDWNATFSVNFRTLF